MVKQEPASPKTSALTARLAKYTYSNTTPSPTRSTVRPVIKVEPRTETAVPTIVSRALTPSVPYISVAVPSDSRPDVGEGSSRGATRQEGWDPSWVVRSDDDLESLTEDVIPTPRRSARSNPIPSSDTHSAYGRDQEGDDKDEGLPEHIESPRRQTRIRSTRANRADRLLVNPEPISTASSSPRARARAGNRRSRVRGNERESRSGSDEEEYPEPEMERRRNGRKRPRAYAGPETYQHMRPLPEILAPDLDGM